MVDSATLAKWLDEGKDRCLVLDARTEEAFRAGHIPTARFVPLPQVKENERDPAWEAFRSIVIYGEDPASGLARAIGKRLIQAEYKDVRWLMGGMVEWRSQGRPISRD